MSSVFETQIVVFCTIYKCTASLGEPYHRLLGSTAPALC